jgi:hypothetical protein
VKSDVSHRLENTRGAAHAVPLSYNTVGCISALHLSKYLHIAAAGPLGGRRDRRIGVPWKMRGPDFSQRTFA